MSRVDKLTAKDTLTVQDILNAYQGSAEFSDIPLTDVNQRGISGDCPLHMACVRGELREVEALLNAGAGVNAPGEMGNTPLHNAAMGGYFPIVSSLLKAGASPEIRNEDGNTARDVAILMKQADVVAVIDDWQKT